MVSYIYIRRGIGLGLCLTLLAFAGCKQKESSEATRLTATSVQMEASQEETAAPVLPEEDPSEAITITEEAGQYFLTGSYLNIDTDACVCSTRDVYTPGTADIIRAQVRSFDDTDIAKIVEPTWTEVSLIAKDAPDYEVPGIYYLYTYNDPDIGDILVNAYCNGDFGYNADMELVAAMYDNIWTQIGLSEVAPDYEDTVDDMQTSIQAFYAKLGLSFSASYLAYSATLNGTDFQTYFYFQTLEDLYVCGSPRTSQMTFDGEQYQGLYPEAMAIVSNGEYYFISIHQYTDLTSVVSEDHELCPLEEAKDTAVTELAQLSSNAIEITRVTLGYIPIDDAEEGNNYYLLPCWMFTYSENVSGFTGMKDAFVDATTGEWIEATNVDYSEDCA